MVGLKSFEKGGKSRQAPLILRCVQQSLRDAKNPRSFAPCNAAHKGQLDESAQRILNIQGGGSQKARVAFQKLDAGLHIFPLRVLSLRMLCADLLFCIACKRKSGCNRQKRLFFKLLYVGWSRQRGLTG